MTNRHEWIYVTKHAGDRYQERTDSPGVGPRVAWLQATRVEPSHLHGDEIRYHARLDLYLIVKQARLVTVVPADEPAEPTPGREHAAGSRGESGVVA